MKKCMILAVTIMTLVQFTSCAVIHNENEASLSEGKTNRLETEQYASLSKVMYEERDTQEFALGNYVSADDPGLRNGDLIQTAEDAIKYAEVTAVDGHIPISVYHFKNGVWLVEYAEEQYAEACYADGTTPIACYCVALSQADSRVIADWHLE